MNSAEYNAIMRRIDRLAEAVAELTPFLPILRDVHAGRVAPLGSLTDILQHGDKLPVLEFKAADFPGLTTNDRKILQESSTGF